MKLSREKANKHNEACEILKKDVLTYREKLFVLENWHEGATNLNAQSGAFFTPLELATAMQIEIADFGRAVDLCAGIGALSFCYVQRVKYDRSPVDLVCVEINPEYVEIGKKIVPEATWVLADALNFKEIQKLGKFDQVFSNPPFGKVKTGTDEKIKYTGSEFELRAVEIASKIANKGTFILPQMSTPFRFSGENGFSQLEGSELPRKVSQFIKQTGLEFDFNCGIDTSEFKDQWKGVKVVCEIVNFDFEHIEEPPQEPQKNIPEQLSIF